MTTADLVVMDLADELVAAIERVGHLESDVDSYRILAQTALHRLHELTGTIHRLERKHARLLDEYRTLRAQTTREAIAA